jgi:hypothetical protein
MLRRISLYRLVSFLLSLTLLLPPVLGQPPTPEGRLTIEEVVKLTRAGFAEDIIITKIKKNGKAFDLSTDELLDLKKDGVSDNVIKYLLDPSQPYTPLPPPSPPASTPAAAAKPANAAKKYPADPYASRVPAEPGLYLFPTDAAVKIDLKFLLGVEAGKSLMKKGKTIAYLIGPAAKTRSKRPMPVFYARLPDGKEIEELVLVTFSEKNGRRELDVGPAGPKQQLKSEQMRPYEPLEVGPRLFRLTPGKLEGGEYLFFFIGSADPTKGIYGKGYDFGIDEVQQQKTK